MHIGFVPTMGALHAGHLSLLKAAKAENDLVICSIFVNPTQFNNLEDLKNYPRNEASDLALLKQDAHCDLVFIPTLEEMYPQDKTSVLDIDLGILEEVMEGKFRPKHFKGVATVVHRFFEIIQAKRAYFGKKDAQQLAVIKNMVKQLELDIEIIGCETLREPNGLAMSSRNLLLTEEEKNKATIIAQTLFQMKEKSAQYSVEELKKWGASALKKEIKLDLEYLEIADANTFQMIDDFNTCDAAIVCVAAKIGKVRLIDNIILFA